MRTTNDPLGLLGDVAAILEQGARRFALVGGLAVSLRAEVRFTRDVDLAVAVTDDRDAENLIFTMHAAGYTPTTTVEQEARGRLAAARLRAPGGMMVDLMFASTGIETEIIDRALPVALPGTGYIAVARAEELLAMKILSMADDRPQDRLDVRSLLAFTPAMDVQSVRDTLELITARGYHRGKDLVALLDQFVTG